MRGLPDIGGIRARVHGRVQGVGFRYATLRFAEARQIRGWVRNHHDGSVEVVARGNALQIDELQTWLAIGPPGARVDGVEYLSPIDVTEDRFEIRP